MIDITKLNSVLSKAGDGISAAQVWDYSDKYYLVETKMNGESENFAYPLMLIDKSNGTILMYDPLDDKEGFQKAVASNPVYSIYK